MLSITHKQRTKILLALLSLVITITPGVSQTNSFWLNHTGAIMQAQEVDDEMSFQFLRAIIRYHEAATSQELVAAGNRFGLKLLDFLSLPINGIEPKDNFSLWRMEVSSLTVTSFKAWTGKSPQEYVVYKEYKEIVNATLESPPLDQIIALIDVLPNGREFSLKIRSNMISSSRTAIKSINIWPESIARTCSRTLDSLTNITLTNDGVNLDCRRPNNTTTVRVILHTTNGNIYPILRGEVLSLTEKTNSPNLIQGGDLLARTIDEYHYVSNNGSSIYVGAQSSSAMALRINRKNGQSESIRSGDMISLSNSLSPFVMMDRGLAIASKEKAGLYLIIEKVGGSPSQLINQGDSVIFYSLENKYLSVLKEKIILSDTPEIFTLESAKVR